MQQKKQLPAEMGNLLYFVQRNSAARNTAETKNALQTECFAFKAPLTLTLELSSPSHSFDPCIITGI
ncbi:hypothetical protein [Paenibacillus albidus]|uniref:hypothetical protein n=1 Tax=Paenibacillus albidus TaxID=2041023 RepID=UPI001BE8BA4F|nr:hypothetical protein [Paenibacillus albidus]